MIEPNREDRRAALSPQLAMRVAILGGIALALFGIVFLRLWFLQVLSGDEYLAQAAGNRTRTVAVQAPRGNITDRNGRTLVGNQLAVDVMISPPRLPRDPARRHDELVRLSRILGKPTKPEQCTTGPKDDEDRTPRMALQCRIDLQVFQLPYADVIARSNVSRAVYGYIDERQDEFPGVSTEQVYLRAYPYDDVGAQLLGTVGQISARELRHDKRFRGVEQGTIVGQNGLEYTYDQYLRGTNGEQRIQVDANGRAVGSEPTTKPRPGYDLRVSIDADVEREGQEALQTGIQLAKDNGNPADAGAFVAMDPRNGQVIGMGSAPSFNPADAERALTQSQYDALLGDNRQLNRATAGLYPVGSTFKVVTASAAMAARAISPGTMYDDVGVWQDGPQKRYNSGHAVYGPVDMVDAFRYSVDTYFYQLGQDLNADPSTHPHGGALQQWARRYGFGTPTGIDLASEAAGNVPDPAWRDRVDREQAECVADAHRAQRDPSYRSPFTGLCAFADGRTWSEGDNVSLAVGQGDFLATPLQMAVAYAAIENGGSVVQPHVGMRITTPDGGIVSTIADHTRRRIEIPNVQTIRDGLNAAAEQPRGTSYDVWRGFPSQYQVYGKTGTAQHGGDQPDQAWYVCYIPDPVRPIVIAVTIERGGFGAESAAPVARLIASQWFRVRKVVQAGSSGDQ